MAVLDWIVDFVSPGVCRSRPGEPRILAIDMCPVTYGYWFVEDDAEPAVTEAEAAPVN